MKKKGRLHRDSTPSKLLIHCHNGHCHATLVIPRNLGGYSGVTYVIYSEYLMKKEPIAVAGRDNALLKNS